MCCLHCCNFEKTCFMKYKLLGRSGLKVSELCLGTMGFGTDNGWGADKATSFAIMEQFANAGGNFLDTA
ncbi:MAG: aldo/keto reductase, partial [Chitinophagaceae bacterium]